MTHGILTELSVPDSFLTPWGKGREGKRKGRGREDRVETPIHSSGSVSARAATARSDSTQPARVRTGMDGATRINGGHR